MLRALFFFAAVTCSFAAGWLLKPAPIPAPTPAVAVQKTQTCRDECEQNAIVAQLPEAVLRACLDRCGGGAPVMRHETPGSITRAPADHRGGLVPEHPYTTTH